MDFWWEEKPNSPQKGGGDAFLDIVADVNHISNSDVGIQIGATAGRAILNDNTFEDVARPVSLAMPGTVLALENAK